MVVLKCRGGQRPAAHRRPRRDRRASGHRDLDGFPGLPLERYAHEALLPRAWTLRENLSAYDATYVALAEVLDEGGAPLLTADRSLARAARAHSDVEVLLAG